MPSSFNKRVPHPRPTRRHPSTNGCPTLATSLFLWPGWDIYNAFAFYAPAFYALAFYLLTACHPERAKRVEGSAAAFHLVIPCANESKACRVLPISTPVLQLVR